MMLLDLFQVSPVTRHFESNSYDAVHLLLEDLPDIQFSRKDTEIFQFVFDHSDTIRFKCFSDCIQKEVQWGLIGIVTMWGT